MLETTYKKKVSLAGFTAQLVTIALLFVFWRLGQKWAVAPAGVILVFLFFFLPKVVRRQEIKFHKKALMLLSTGKAGEVPGLARNQLLLSLFGNSAPIDAKLGLAYAQLGDYQAVVECLSAAIPYAPSAELPALQAAYVKALFVTGNTTKAEEQGRLMLNRSTTRLSEVLIVVARSRMAQGKMGPDTAMFLDEAMQLNPGGDTETMRLLSQVEMDLAHGRKTQELPDNLDSTERFIKVWIQLVRGKLKEKRGQKSDAIQSYSNAVKIGADERCFFADSARQRIDILSNNNSNNNVETPPDEETNLDDAVRRKKKRRR